MESSLVEVQLVDNPVPRLLELLLEAHEPEGIQRVHQGCAQAPKALLACAKTHTVMPQVPRSVLLKNEMSVPPTACHLID